MHLVSIIDDFKPAPSQRHNPGILQNPRNPEFLDRSKLNYRITPLANLGQPS